MHEQYLGLHRLIYCKGGDAPNSSPANYLAKLHRKDTFYCIHLRADSTDERL